ncbi:MAG: glycosyltransferase [Actinomycetota bacterium]|nr:glycosyltransferase [Actinomycetota bacterium]
MRRNRSATDYRPGVTVVTVNWNSLPFLSVMLDATRAMSPPDTEILVVDNGSTDGSRDYLATRRDVRVARLPLNFGHGIALDLALPTVDTEFVAILDVDAFPINDKWLSVSVAALESGALVAGAHMHRNFIHPCFFVTRTKLIHDLGLTFRPFGRTQSRFRVAPLFLDVAEALCQRLIIYGGGSAVLHRFPITSLKGPGMAGAVFGGLVYHNQGATWGERKGIAPSDWHEAVGHHLGTFGIVDQAE